MKIRLSMNGVLPMIAPVSGSRSGAPDGNRENATITTTSRASRRARSGGPWLPPSGRPRPRPRSVASIAALRRVIWAESRLDDALGHEHGDDCENDVDATEKK